MTSIYTLALLVCALNLAARVASRGSALEAPFAWARRRLDVAARKVGIERCAFATIVALVVLFLVQMRSIDGFVQLAPGSSRMPYDFTMLVLDMLEVLALGLLYVSLSMSKYPRTVRAALIVAPIVMYGFALSSKIVGSSDLYAYIAYAKLGPLAYTPPKVPFTGAFGMLNVEIARAWVTLNPSPYGPLLLALDRLCAGPATSVWQAIVTLRLLAAAAVLLSTIALRRLGFGVPLLAIFMLDPQIIENYAFDAHNDVLAVAAVLAALAVDKQSRVAAIGFAIAAGSIKAPYVFLALLVSAGEATLARRVRVAAIVVVGTVAVSALGGLPYLHALTQHADENGVADFSLVTRAAHALAAAVAVVAIAAAVIFRRTFFNAVWTLPALTAQTLHWYAWLGVPYAVFERRHTAIYFAIFPVTAFLLNEYSLRPWPHLATMALVFAIAAFAFTTKRNAPQSKCELGSVPMAVTDTPR